MDSLNLTVTYSETAAKVANIVGCQTVPLNTILSRTSADHIGTVFISFNSASSIEEKVIAVESLPPW